VYSNAGNTLVNKGTIVGTEFTLQLTLGHGGSGGPLFDPASGEAIGVMIQMRDVFVAIDHPDNPALRDHYVPGISYAEPILPVIRWCEEHGYKLPQNN
jgi:hypothetical protein